MIFLRLLTLIVALISAASAAAADDFTLKCPADSYMTGFEGYAGAWIDAMRIKCARWNAKSETLDPPIKTRRMVGRSGGGNETKADCPEGWFVSGGYRPNYVWGDDDDVPVLHSIEFSCRPLDEDRVAPRTFGSTSSVAERAEEMIAAGECPGGELGLFATGIGGSHRRFVEGISLICGPPPQRASPVAATKANPRAKYSNPAVSGTKRIGSDIVGAPPPP